MSTGSTMGDLMIVAPPVLGAVGGAMLLKQNKILGVLGGALVGVFVGQALLNAAAAGGTASRIAMYPEEQQRVM